jgi:hypothetical protein
MSKYRSPLRLRMTQLKMTPVSQEQSEITTHSRAKIHINPR